MAILLRDKIASREISGQAIKNSIP